MKFFLFFLFPFLLLGDLHSEMAFVEDRYQEALRHGSNDEFYDFYEYMTAFVGHPIAIWQVGNLVNDILAVFDGYWEELRNIVIKERIDYLQATLVKSISAYDRKKMANCILISLFGMGEFSDEVSRKKIRDQVVETSVKKKIVESFWELDKERLLRKLEEEKLKKLLQIFCEASDPYLREIVVREFQGCATVGEYLQRYDMAELLKLHDYVFHEEPLSDAVKNFYFRFAKKVEELKAEYGYYLDL